MVFGLVSTVVSDGLGSVLMISARVDSRESKLSLAGLVGELTGETRTETRGLEELGTGVGEAWGMLKINVKIAHMYFRRDRYRRTSPDWGWQYRWRSEGSCQL